MPDGSAKGLNDHQEIQRRRISKIKGEFSEGLEEMTQIKALIPDFASWQGL